jgi:hypothetical protein
LPTALARFDRDDLLVVHILILSVGCAPARPNFSGAGARIAM